MPELTQVLKGLWENTVSKRQPGLPELDEIHFPTCSLDWFSQLRQRTNDMNGSCVLCGRESQRIPDLLEVNGQQVDLCGPCLGKPVAVVLLDLAHLGQPASYPAPSGPATSLLPPPGN